MNLYIFDCDGVILDSPRRTPENILKWETYYDTTFPYKLGWWSKLESMDNNVFDIKPRIGIMDDYRRARNDKDGYCILLTSRMNTFKNIITKILNMYDFKFDKYIFKRFGRTKPQRVEEILDKLPDIKYIEIWDDREEELKLYQQWYDEIISVRTDLIIKINKV